MGGSQTSRRFDINQELTSYISSVRRRKPFSVARRQKGWSLWPVWHCKEEELLSPISNVHHQNTHSLLRTSVHNEKKVTIETASWWEGVKTSMRDTVRRDLEMINQQTVGGTKMKVDDDFIDFEEGGLKVVPIPEEPEVTKKQQPQPESVMLDPFADEPIPPKEAARPKKAGLLSRWFGKKKAAKEEAKLDMDFVLRAAPINIGPPTEGNELKDDFKELSKLFLKMLERMNKEQINSFKSTEDFNRFKNLLQKHKVIK